MCTQKMNESNDIRGGARTLTAMKSLTGCECYSVPGKWRRIHCKRTFQA